MLRGFNVVVFVRCNGGIIENGTTIYQHARGHKLAVKEQAVFGRNQQVCVGHVVCQSIGHNADGVTGFILLQGGVDLHRGMACPCHVADFLFAICINANGITNLHIFNLAQAFWCFNQGASKEAVDGAGFIIIREPAWIFTSHQSGGLNEHIGRVCCVNNFVRIVTR